MKGMTRKYFPKDRDLSEIIRDDIEWVEKRLINRLRKFGDLRQ
jgi:IS30 family transposase